MVRHRNARLNIDLLEELGRQRKSGRKVYLATNQEHIRATYLLEVLGLGDHCDGIFYSAALGCRKPDISFFEKASALSGLPPNQLLLFDDTYANITAARASGWNAAQWHEGRSLSAIIEELVSDPVMMTDVFIDLPCLGIPVQIAPSSAESRRQHRLILRVTLRRQTVLAMAHRPSCNALLTRFQS